MKAIKLAHLTEYFSKNIHLLIIIVISLFTVFPFVFLTQYNIPGASDDLLHGWFKADKSYFDGIWSWYSGGYNGRFANAFFMQLPGRFFLEPWFGKTFPILLFVSLFFAIFSLFQSYKKDTSKNLIYSLVLLAFFLAKTPDVKQFFWFSGSTVYVIPAIFYFLFISLQIKNLNKTISGLNIFLSILYLFIIIGSHENWMIIGFITSIIFCCYPLLSKSRLNKGQIWIISFSIFFAACVVFAPGTTFRMTMEGNKAENADFWASLSLAPFYISEFINAWILNWGALFTIAGLSILASHKQKNTKILSVYANDFWIYLIIVFVLAGVFILLYSLGHFVPLRIRGLVPTFIVTTIIVLHLINLIGQNDKIKTLVNRFTLKTGYLILAFGLIIVFSNSTNVKNAYTDIFSGNAKEAAFQSEWVQNYLKNTQSKTVHVPQINKETKTLYTFVVPENTDGWYHWSTAIYFKKDKILIDYNHNINEFIKIQSNTNGIPLNKDYKFCPVKDYYISDLRSLSDAKIQVNAQVTGIMPSSKAMLVFESDPIWQGFPLNDIINSSGTIDFSWDFPADSMFNTNLLKIYFFNPSEDIVFIQSFNSRMETE